MTHENSLLVSAFSAGLLFFATQSTAIAQEEFAEFPNDVDVQDSSYTGYTLSSGTIHRTVTDLVVPHTVGDIDLAVRRTFTQDSGTRFFPFYQLKYYGDSQGSAPYPGEKQFSFETPEGSRMVAEANHFTGQWVLEPQNSEKTNNNRYLYLIRPDGKMELSVVMPSGITAVFESRGAFHWNYWATADDDFRIIRLTDKFDRSLTFQYSGSWFWNAVKISDEAGNYIEFTLSGVGHPSRVESSDGQVVDYTYTGASGATAMAASVTYSDGTTATGSYVDRGTRAADYTFNEVRAVGQIQSVKFETYDEDSTTSGFDEYEAVKKVSSLSTGYVLSERSITVGSYEYMAKETRGDGASREAKVVTPWKKKRMMSWIKDFNGDLTDFDQESHGGVLHKITDARGNDVDFERENVFELITKRINPDPGSSYEEWTYLDSGVHKYVSQYRDERGYLTKYTRDPLSGVLTKIDYSDGSFETWSGFNQYNQPTVHRLRNGASEYFTYDSLGKMTKISNPRTTGSYYWTNYSYYPNGHVWENRLKTVTDPNNNATTYEYDLKFVNGVQSTTPCSGRGLVTKIINADGTYKSFGYNVYGDKVWEEDELRNRTTYVYDAYQRLTETTDPLNRTTYLEYGDSVFESFSHAYNKPVRKISPSGKITAYEYDANKQVTKMTEGASSPDSKDWVYEYDAVGNRTKIREMIGKSPTVYRDTTFVYDSRNRRTKQTAPLGRITLWEYDAAGNITKVMFPDSTFSSKVYDSMNRVTDSSDEMGQLTRYTYHPSGMVNQIIDPRGNTYSLSYDYSNRKTLMYYPGGSFEQWVYNSAGNLYYQRNRAGNFAFLYYDDRNREIEKLWGGNAAPTVWTGYDAVGRVAWKSNFNGMLTYTYDAAGQMTHEEQKIYGPTSQNDGRTVTSVYLYDDDGMMTDFAGAEAGIWNQFTYDNRRAMTAVQLVGSPNSNWVAYDYNAAGERTTQTYYNGIETELRYDGAGRINYIDTYDGQPSFPVFKQEFGYDSRDRRTWVVRDESHGDSWQYQADSQLIKQKSEVYRPDLYPGNPAVFTDDFAYDAAGNRTSWTQNGGITSYSADALNQYTSITGLSVQHADGLGNITQLGVWTYTYDAENRLERAVGPGYDIFTFYDAQGRLSKIVNNGVYEYRFYNGTQQYLRQYQDGTWIDHTVWGDSQDEVVARYTTAHFWQFYHQGALNSTVAITEWGASVVERYVYDAFGGAGIYDGNWNPRSSSAYGNRFQYTGQEWWPELGLHNYKARFYSSELGRFLQTDPIRFAAGDLNLYRYVGNNVINASDPMGTQYKADGDDDEDEIVRRGGPGDLVRDFGARRGAPGPWAAGYVFPEGTYNAAEITSGTLNALGADIIPKARAFGSRGTTSIASKVAQALPQKTLENGTIPTLVREQGKLKWVIKPTANIGRAAARGVPVAGVIVSGVTVATAENKWRAGFGVAGSTVGGIVGGAGGAFGGSFVTPVAGTAVGGVAGAVGGAAVGDSMGTGLYDWIFEGD